MCTKQLFLFSTRYSSTKWPLEPSISSTSYSHKDEVEGNSWYAINHIKCDPYMSMLQVRAISVGSSSLVTIMINFIYFCSARGYLIYKLRFKLFMTTGKSWLININTWYQMDQMLFELAYSYKCNENIDFYFENLAEFFSNWYQITDDVL